MNSSVKLRDVLAWNHAWLPYVCSDCNTCRPVAVSSRVSDVNLSASDHIMLHRQIGCALGWYLLRESDRISWACPECYGKRVLKAISSRSWQERKVIDDASDFRIAVLLIGPGKDEE